MTGVRPPGVLPADVIRIVANAWTEPFWEAAAQHRLVLPRCGACGTYRFPPTPFCWRCRNQAVDWVDHDGRGTLYSFTVVRHAVIPEVRDALPVVAGVLELDGADGCRLVGNVVGCAPEDVRIGARFTVGWYDVREGESVPVFRLGDG